ncbi:MAG: hypothetical protein R3C59_04900 [Planctomycetaceae bacterium]
MQQAPLAERLRYRFDTFMSKGGRSIFTSLLVVFLTLFTILVSLRWLTMMLVPQGMNSSTKETWWGQAFVIFLEMTDPGNMNWEIPASPWYKISGILAGLAGVIILSMLIAFITTALDQKLADLRKGFSRVIEEDHTLILGWNDRVIEILKELFIANESEPQACIVILADRPKEEMDDFLTVHVPDRKTTKIVTRSGKPSAKVKLDLVSMQTSKSIIVLASCSDAASDAEKAASDARTIKTILRIMASRDAEKTLNIVAELFFDRSRTIAESISPEEVTTIDGQQILAKILVQTSRSVGLSVVYSETLSFDGCELYFYKGGWEDTAFSLLQFHFPDGVPIGMRHPDGTLTINPAVDAVVKADDEILILAEDDSTIEYRTEPVAEPRDLPLAGGRNEQTVEHELLIGWNAKVPTIIREYSDYVKEGSKIDILVREPTQELRDHVSQLNTELDNLTIELIKSNPSDVASLKALEPFKYDNILILSSGDDNADPETTDSETIVILLLLRQIIDEVPEEIRNQSGTKIITEIMDSDNQELVSRAGVNDFIIPTVS